MKNKRLQKSDIFIRVSGIIDTTRGVIVKAINVGMVGAYWQIGKEIVSEEQKGKSRAEYGKRVVEKLSRQLTEKYGAGWSSSHLWHVRQFYLLYKDRSPANLHTASADLDNKILHTLRAELSWSHYRILIRRQSFGTRCLKITSRYSHRAINCIYRQKMSLGGS